MRQQKPFVLVCAPSREKWDWDIIIRMLNDDRITAKFAPTVQEALALARKHSKLNLLVSSFLPAGGTVAELIQALPRERSETHIIIAGELSKVYSIRSIVESRDPAIAFCGFVFHPGKDPASVADELKNIITGCKICRARVARPNNELELSEDLEGFLGCS